MSYKVLRTLSYIQWIEYNGYEKKKRENLLTIFNLSNFCLLTYAAPFMLWKRTNEQNKKFRKIERGKEEIPKAI
jgi:hypothetical protein